MKKKNIQISKSVSDSKGFYEAIDQGTGMRLPHDFFSPKIDECYEFVFQKYQRRIRRIYTEAQQSDCLIIYIETSRSSIDETTLILDSLSSVYDILSPRSLSFFYCHAVSSAVAPRFELIHTNRKELVLYRLDYPLDRDCAKGELPNKARKLIFRALLSILEKK